MNPEFAFRHDGLIVTDGAPVVFICLGEPRAIDKVKRRKKDSPPAWFDAGAEIGSLRLVDLFPYVLREHQRGKLLCSAKRAKSIQSGRCHTDFQKSFKFLQRLLQLQVESF